ncbi:MAG TPA: hypothetical protein HA283_06190 [Nanoarchaeota archaeon]|nr:hypothetical protein [Nanoarchaeota archaeon]HIH63861.1 hypothetical protein [Nanoarchaeota archaeon]HIJ09760.1 hypothetical protein [Nanoarchaeota archaeon]
MKKEIKVKLNGFSGQYENPSDYLKKYFPIKVFNDNFNVKFVNNLDEAEIIFESTVRSSDYKFLNEKKKKVIIISGEDLFKERDVFNLIESVVHKLGFKEEKWKIMDKIDSVLPKFVSSIPIIYFFPKFLKYVKKISRGEIKNAYALVQNDMNGENIFILPCFFHTLYYDLPKLIKNNNKKIQDRKKFCAFIVSSNSSRERVHFFKKLSKYKRVDSYGKVQNNMGNQLFKSNWNTNNEVYKNYKFVIGFENNFAKEYISEKAQVPMLSGAIPIYRGAPNIHEYFNTKSFINYDDYGSDDKVIKKIIELDQDDEKYLKMANEPWFVDNKIPKIFKEKEMELIKFYKKILES